MPPRPALRTLFLGATLLVASCSKSEDKPAPATPPAAAVPSGEITSATQKGMPLELVFGIKQQDIVADGSRVIQARGTYKGAEVGLIVVLGAKWESVAPTGNEKSKFVFHTGTVEYRTIGEASNALLTALDDIYGTKLNPHPMRAETKFSGISLQGDPADLAKGEVRLKITFESQTPERQAELYTNIDLQKHELHLVEKDKSYRKPLLQALQKD